MFAILVVEREPYKLENLPTMLQMWLLSTGGFAAVGLLLVGIAMLAQRSQAAAAERRPSMKHWLVALILCALAFTFAPAGVNALFQKLGWAPQEQTWNRFVEWVPNPGMLAILFVASCAVVAVLIPVVRDLFRMRMRRIWALARLSFKEAVRRRILWAAFGVILVVFLFVNWFLDSKPEYQVQNYVRVMFWAMAPILIVSAGLLAAFSIPNDLRNQTMHTIVTKPVERFEIVVGRSLGYILLMSLALAGMTAFSLIFVARQVAPEAMEESYKARVPIFGAFQIMERGKPTEGISVGREWGYRKYISGGLTNERATWAFGDVSPELARRDTVRCEFQFDVFRTSKGTENKGIYCTFFVYNPAWKGTQDEANAYHAERDKVLAAPLDKEIDRRAQEENWDRDKIRAAQLNGLAKKYGYYELLSKEVIDYHTLGIELPAGLFDMSPEALQNSSQGRRVVQVSVRCESPTQYLGVAKHDLYLLDDENPFAMNFFKGALGLWFRLCLVVVLAVTLSTYLSGIIAFITTMFFYILGLFTEFIQKVAEGRLEGGGPMEALLRLGQGVNLVVPLDQSPTYRVAQVSDVAFRGFLFGVLNIVPDVERYDLTSYVSQGFDISGATLLMDNALPLLGYLIPCVVLGYYLMKSREIAA